MKSANFANGKLQAKPDWKHSYSRSHNDFKTVEAPLSTLGRFGFATLENKQAYKETGNDRYMQSLTRMVILTETKGNKTIGFLMTIIPDKEYLEATKFMAFGSSYKKWQKDFSGYVLYHTLSGDFANGWKLAKGEVVKTVKQGSASDIHLQLKSATSCTDYYWIQWYQDCTSYYTNGEYNSTTCGSPYSEWTYLYTECYDDGSGSGGGGGYTPPSPPPPSDPNLPCSGDPIKNPQINPTSSGRVLGGTYGCVRITTDSPNCDEPPYNKTHSGVDISAPLCSDLYAMRGGVVTIGNEPAGLGLYAKVTVGGTAIIYGHLQEVNHQNGDIIATGDIIGKTGNSGNALGTLPHVHISISVDGSRVDPLPYFTTTFDPTTGISTPCNN